MAMFKPRQTTPSEGSKQRRMADREIKTNSSNHNHNTSDTFFGVSTITEPNLDPESVYQEGCCKSSAEVIQFDQNIRLRCLEGWFFRSAWTEKFRFIMEISNLTTGVYVLQQVLKCFDGIYTKDVIDSFARNRIGFLYDIIPIDDNRAMPMEELSKVMQEDILWFLNLETSSQIGVIVKLLKLGGGGLIFSAYKEIDRIYKERKEMNMVLSAVDATIRELTEGNTQKEDESKMTIKQEESNRCKYTILKKEQIARRNDELNEYKKKRGLLGGSKKLETSEVVDYVQVLPIWLNRKIMLELSEKDLEELKRTGKYWKKMIEDAVRERDGRMDIDEKIRKLGACGGRRLEESSDESEDFEDVPVLGSEALLAALHLRHSDLVRIQKENESAKYLKMNISVWEEFCFEQIVCSVNETCKILAASTSNRSIMFYSLRTGVRMENLVTSIPSNITSMAVHDEGFHVIVGCEDGSLLCMNIRKNEKKITYSGHSGPILRIHISDEKFVSAAEDRTVKQFDLWSGLCLFCVHVDDSITSMIVLKRHSFPRLAIAGTAQGKLVFIDLGKKKIYREVVVHERKVKGIAEVGSLLVTHSTDRTIRMWSVNHLEEENCEKIRPFSSIRLKSVATVVECLGNEIFAACVDGKVRLICKLTGAAKRVVEVTQKKPIAGIYVMQEKDTTKMIMWHEGGIEMRSFSTGKAQGENMKLRKAMEKVADRRKASQLSRRRIFSFVPNDPIHLTIPKLKMKRYKATRVKDREMVQVDRSCTTRKLREVNADEFVPYFGDVFTRMIKKVQVFKDAELTTFPRLRNRNQASPALDSLSHEFSDESTYF